MPNFNKIFNLSIRYMYIRKIFKNSQKDLTEGEKDYAKTVVWGAFQPLFKKLYIRFKKVYLAIIKRF